MRAEDSPLLVDLYELTMLQSYYDQGMTAPAVFELFFRHSPERGFYLFAGTEQLLEWLEGLRFGPEELAWLRDCGHFTEDFVERMAGFRFTGDVHALAEGRLCFAGEPVVRVTAPLPEAQFVESRLMNLLHFQTLIATKAARCRLAAGERALVDFGMRRAHGAEAALLAARAGYIGGLSGTATCLAGAHFGIPVVGTMAHSYILAHPRERDAFAAFAHSHPHNVVLLIDTYDTEAAAREVVALAPALARAGIVIQGVRLDSGDLGEHARAVRSILDAGGLPDVEILVSGGLDEHRIAALCAAGAPIDGFGVGTRLDTSADLPYLDCAYKLQAYDGRPVRKRSEGKATWPGAKQVYRLLEADGRLGEDRLVLEGTQLAGEPLLDPIMRGGRRLQPPEPLQQPRERAQAELARLPRRLRRLQPVSAPFPVRIGADVRALAAEADRLREQQL